MTPRQIHVLHILSDSTIGGAGRQVLYLLRSADRAVFRFSVILPRGSMLCERFKPLANVYEVDGISDRSLSPFATRALARLIRKISPDIVHTHSCASGRHAACLVGVPIRVMTKHCSDMPPRIMTLPPIKALVGAALGKTVSAFIATDESAAVALAAVGVDRRRISVIVNGAEPLRTVDETEKSALREKLGIAKNDFVVGIFARLEEPKAHETLLLAARTVLSECPDAFFLIVGDGSRRFELEDMAKALRIEDRVGFCGFCEDIAPYMALCKVNANVSHGTETSPLAISEGMSMGCVPVVSQIGGNAAMVKDCGIVCPCDDPQAFAEAFLFLKNNPTSLETMVQRSRERFEQKLTSTRMTRETEELYLRLAEKEKRNENRRKASKRKKK